MTSDNYFQTLHNINVNHLKEKKGRFDYLSWADAVAQLLLIYPDSTWEIHEYDSLPYLKTETGVFVKVSVTVKGITRTQIHPVLDNYNKPIKNPDCFHINTSIQRALAKAIALHGLGLYIFRGEDLPDGEPHPRVSNLIPDVQVELLSMAPTLEILEREFKKNYKLAKDTNNKSLEAELIQVKDKRKSELTGLKNNPQD